MLMTKTTYRAAVTEDVPRLLILSKDMWQESPYFRDISFSEPTLARGLIGRIVADSGAVFVAEIDGAIVGFIAGKTANYGFSEELLASEDGWYVVPEFRGGMIGPRLLNAFYRWGKEQGAREVLTGPSTGIGAEKVYALVERMGFGPAGRLFKKEC